VRRIGVDERRARLAVRHRLVPAERTADVAEITRSLVALHASDPASVVLSAIVRMPEPDPAAVARALYDERTVVRMLAMRRTLWTVDLATLPVVHASSTLAVAANQRRLLLQMLEGAGVGGEDPARWLRKVERSALEALRAAGEATAAQLSKLVPELALQLTVAAGKAYEGKVGVGSRVLLLLAADGHIARGRPTGGWTSGVHRWAPIETWLGGPVEALDPAVAKAELVRRWLERFGPGTEADLAWWTGWPLGQVRTALRVLEIETVEAETGDGSFVPAVVLPDDVDPVADPGHWEALLPSLDPTTMGWKDRSWYLGPHKERVFDRNGNAGPTLWVDGRIVGGWAQRKDTGVVVTELLEPVPTATSRRITRRAAQLQDVLGDVRITPRFPTPIDKDLRR
jgi:hypothetical protein